MADLKETPLKSVIMQRIGQALAQLRNFGDEAIPNPFEGSVMDPDRTKGAGSFFIGKSPETADSLAHGFSPFKLKSKGVGSRIPELRENKAGDIAELASMTPVGALTAGTKAAGPALAAIKALPGGHWTPSSMKRMSELLKGGAGEDVPQHITDWLDKSVPRYFQRHAGTDRDPARTLDVQGTSYENIMDRSLRQRTYEDMQPQGIGEMGGIDADMPANIRPGESAWHFNPRPPLAQYLQHAGDFAQTVPPGDLARMDIPTLLQQAARQAQRAQVPARRQVGAPEEFMPHVARLTADIPGGPFIQGQNANWYRFDNKMDPKLIRQHLSADTCVGRHCIGGMHTANGEPGFQRGQFLPMLDPRTGVEPPGVPGGSTNSYASGIINRGNRAYSLRTPEGDVVATAYANKPQETGVPRSQIRDLIGKPTYLNWQKRQAEMGNTVEGRKWILPGGRHRVHIGDEAQNVNVGPAQGSPARGLLDSQQIQSIIDMHPGTREMLTPYLQGPVAYNLEQIKGFMNRPVSPKFQDEVAQFLGSKEINPQSARYDLESSGFFPAVRGAQSQIVKPRELIEGAQNTSPEQFQQMLANPAIQRLLETPPNRLSQQEADLLRDIYSMARRMNRGGN